MKNILLVFIIMIGLMPQTTLAQKGTIRGVVIDDASGESLIGVSVVKTGTTTGTVSDLDGNFSFEIEEGIHTISFSYLSYAKQTINDVVLKAGQITKIDVRMKSESEQISEVVVTAKAVQNTESALLTIQKKSANVIDGISSQTISKMGDGDAASALKRVTGVSVEGGRHVYVRGLGDRYTKTILNGTDIPGLDPDRNTVQLDIFPTNLIDNLIVYKNFSPDLPGDFTGGMVNVVTKDFPDTKTLSASASFGYNPDMHFNKSFITHNYKPVDGLALAKDSRELPFSSSTIIPDPVLGDPKLHDLTASFDRQMAAAKNTSVLDQSYSLAFGNQINREKATWGYNLALNYSNEYEYFDEVEFGEYQKNSSDAVYELEPLKIATGSIGNHEVMWSGLAGASVKINAHKISLMALHVQNGQKTAAELEQTDFFNSSKLIKDNLGYTERSLSNAFLSGKHRMNNFEVEWKNSFTYSQITDPDLRTTAFSVSGTDTTLNSGDGAQVSRIFRDLNELNNNLKADVTFFFKQWSGIESKLKFGVSNTFKMRDYGILNYKFQVEGVNTFNGDPDWLFIDENIWMPESRRGTYVIGNSEPANMYEASSNVLGIYVMNELALHKKLKAIYGLRFEKADNFYTGQNNTGSVVFNKEKVLDEIDFLPAVSLVYSVIENMNFRVSYGRTVARPSFRENSIAQIYDPIQDRTYIGGIDLSTGTTVEETHIDNADLRWEYFFKPGEVISISGFYKHLKNPIEIVAFELNPDNVQPRNVGNGTVLGIEFELRKNFGFINEKLKGLSFGTNVTLVNSKIKMSDEEYTGSTGSGGRVGNARDGEEIKDTRVMLGQSPFIANAYVGYANSKVGFEANVIYNVQGKRLSVVGSGRIPDVYEMPFHSLNFKVSQKFGKVDRWQVSFSAENLIGDGKEKIYESFKAENRLYESYLPGRKFSAGLSFTIK